MGAVLHARALREGGMYDKYIADTLHPNDEGHRLYADTVTERLSRWLGGDSAVLTEYPLPAAIGKTWCGACIVAPKNIPELSLSGFRITEAPGYSRYGHCLETAEEGSSFSFSFTGCGFGFCWGGANINGDVEVTIDGGEPLRIKSWDHYVRSFHRLRAAIVTRELPQGKHHVCVKALPFCPTDTSPERIVRIDGFFVF